MQHPASKCNTAQRTAFNAIAAGTFIHASERVIAALVEKGIIEEYGTRCVGRDALGNIDVPIYGIPTHLHIQWCEWCSKSVGNRHFLTRS
jgi:hypothetical protein